jgi:hypothetical protein
MCIAMIITVIADVYCHDYNRYADVYCHDYNVTQMCIAMIITVTQMCIAMIITVTQITDEDMLGQVKVSSASLLSLKWVRWLLAGPGV